EIAMHVAQLGLDDCEIGLQPAFTDIGPPLEFFYRLAFGKLGSIGGRRVERRDTGAASADTLRQGSLRHEFELYLAGKISVRKGARVRRPGEGADHLAHHAGIDHRGDPDPAIAGIVVDDGEVLGSLVDQGVDQFDRRARTAKAADHDARAVADVGDSLRRAADCLVHADFSLAHANRFAGTRLRYKA